MNTRKVKDIAYWSNGSRAADQLVKFTLERGSFTTSELVFPKEVVATTSHLGEFEVTLWANAEGLEPVYWLCTLPTGEETRLMLTAGATAVTLREVRTPLVGAPIAVDDETWTRLKNAALEYSGYRPLEEFESHTPQLAKAQTTPKGTIGALVLDYGDEMSFGEVMTAPEGSQGWCFHQGKLYVSPAPTDTSVPISVVWQKSHPADEATRTFPSIPETDMLIVKLLADAQEAEEEQAAVDAGLSSYTIGSTTVKWAQQGGGQSSTLTRGQQLRQRAISQLQGPMASWG